MDVPDKGQTVESYIAAVEKHVAANYVMLGGVLTCKACLIPIEAGVAWASLHTSLLPHCGGPGDVVRPLLPYCPECEGKPEEPYTCIHVTRETFEQAEMMHVHPNLVQLQMKLHSSAIARA